MNDRMQDEQEWFRQLTEMEDKKHKKHKKQKASDGGRRPITQPKRRPDDSKRGFKSVAGMDELKILFLEGLINVLRNPECARAFGVRPPSILLYGPSGCGKTFFAEKAAEEAGIAFMKVEPDSIASPYIHGTQEKIEEVFKDAEAQAPVLLFFDEFETMVPRRSGSNNDYDFRNGETNEFLCKLNNVADKGVYVVAATNRPDCIDPAVLRTGRIDEIVYVDMPDIKAREGLFQLLLSDLPVTRGIDHHALAEMTEGYNCSDIDYIVRVAARKMFNANVKDKRFRYKTISQKLIEETIRDRIPSVDSQSLRGFERMRAQFSVEGRRQPATIGFRR